MDFNIQEAENLTGLSRKTILNIVMMPQNARNEFRGEDILYRISQNCVPDITLNKMQEMRKMLFLAKEMFGHNPQKIRKWFNRPFSVNGAQRRRPNKIIREEDGIREVIKILKNMR